MAANLPPSTWIERSVEGDLDVLHLLGAWRLAHAAAIADQLRHLGLEGRTRFLIDGSRLESLDTSAGFVLLKHLGDIGCTRETVSGRGFDPRYERLLLLVYERMRTPPASGHTVHLGLLQRVGSAVVEVGGLLKSHVDFVGVVVQELANLARNPRRFRSRETVSQFEAVCVDAVPIVALVNFLIGVVIAYVLGVQAQRYGATLFVADGIALGICRELSPILSSVLVAGRSGAAFTAQIGTMKVEEEIDAISTLGLSPIQVLVIPRLLALMVALPLLVFVGDVAGIAGGLMIGAWQLDIAPQVFMDRVHSALELRHFVIGLAKAPAFAAVVAIIACGMGLKVSRDARSLGENTTSTVVQCIVWVIILDAAFAVALQHMGI
jgi:phospholipid/cholesterol/gamma-HCH transport system permease protein